MQLFSPTEFLMNKKKYFQWQKRQRNKFRAYIFRIRFRDISKSAPSTRNSYASLPTE